MLFNEDDPMDKNNEVYVDSASEKNCSYDNIIKTTVSNYDAYLRKSPLYRNNQKKCLVLETLCQAAFGQTIVVNPALLLKHY